MSSLTRRTTMRMAAGCAAMLALPFRRAAANSVANPRADVADAIAAFCKGRKPMEGRVELDLPVSSENANAVPVSARIGGAMSEASHCEEIMLIAEKNPRPAICSFQFASPLAVPHINTRVRLAET